MILNIQLDFILHNLYKLLLRRILIYVNNEKLGGGCFNCPALVNSISLLIDP